ncbi:MAG: hypothetical protein B7Y07_05960 [Halothiobacillus sp. 24-54-40]|jgi:hypothetical protein|nr:MAG: hypothetical protein B7Y58_04170 [Halothiobacillus sp. 35-54-62]OYZ86956.1 MAG: hypothetical protein B7Y07_05960 [Halothiobacillus sp. 24-54-40]OZA79046.1 MAG: hypothetical protein B7X64_11325 [Halothiobacillus sp. 39-53-45]HQS02902.1 hypothetical protein [Halothiobacillus sp.]HQS29289.1 hypothetical protein [Halothiobacillus sp.]
MSQENIMQCPTAMSAVLLRLYEVENNGLDDLDAGALANWWAKKVDDPEACDAWLNGKLWRLFARHLHAWVDVNEPDEADLIGCILGIDNPLIPQPQMVSDEDGEVHERWSLEDYRDSLPPYGFETWQKPIRRRKLTPVSADSDSESRFAVEREPRFSVR